MIEVYAVLVEKDRLDMLSASPYELQINYDGYIRLVETTKEELTGLAYIPLEELSYEELNNLENNIVIVHVNEIIRKNDKVKKKV